MAKQKVVQIPQQAIAENQREAVRLCSLRKHHMSLFRNLKFPYTTIGVCTKCDKTVVVAWTPEDGKIVIKGAAINQNCKD